MMQFLLPLIKTLGASGAAAGSGALGGATGGLGASSGGLANLLLGGNGLGMMPGSTMGGGAQGPTQGSGLLRMLSGGGKIGGKEEEPTQAARPRSRFQI